MSAIGSVSSQIRQTNEAIRGVMEGLRIRRSHISVLLALAVWEVFPTLGIVPSLLVPPLHEVVITFWQTVFVTDELLSQTLVSIRRALTGFVLGVAVAIPIGVLIGWRQILYDYAVVYMDTLRTLPAVALIPIFLLIFGPSETTIMAVIFYPVFFYQLVATVYGTQNINQTLIESMRVLKMGEWRMFRQIFVPGSLPGIFSGLRQNTATTLVLTIVAEMLLASDGLGRYIMDTQRQFQIPRTYAGILMILVIGYALNKTVVFVQRRYLYWSERQTM